MMNMNWSSIVWSCRIKWNAAAVKISDFQEY